MGVEMAFDPSELFGMPQESPNPMITVALILQHLAILLEQAGKQGSNVPGEITVRPLIEPLGGS
jgi:hypothetical protein